jgi:hypothetical protein
MILEREHVRAPAWKAAASAHSEPCTCGSQRYGAVFVTMVEWAWIARRSTALLRC